MIIKEKNYDIDFTDADIIEKIDIANSKVQEQIKELEQKLKNISPAEGIRQECKILKDFLDYVIGDGTSKEIFGDKDSLKDCLQIFEDIIEERNKQLNSISETFNKYSPDRLQR